MTFTSPKLNLDLVIKVLKQYNAKPKSQLRKDLDAANASDDPAPAIAAAFKKNGFDGLGEAELDEIINYRGSDKPTPEPTPTPATPADPATEKKKDEAAKISISVMAGVYTITTKPTAVKASTMGLSKEGKIQIDSTSYEVTVTRDSNGDIWCTWGDANAVSFKVKFYTDTTKNSIGVWAFDGHQLTKKTGSSEPDKEDFKGEKQAVDPDDKAQTKSFFAQYGYFIVCAGVLGGFWLWYRHIVKSEKTEEKKKRDELRDNASRALIEMSKDIKGLKREVKEHMTGQLFQQGMKETERKHLLDEIKDIARKKYQELTEGLPENLRGKALDQATSDKFSAEVREAVRTRMVDLMKTNLALPIVNFVNEMEEIGLVSAAESEDFRGKFGEDAAEKWTTEVCGESGDMSSIVRDEFLGLELKRIQEVRTKIVERLAEVVEEVRMKEATRDRELAEIEQEQLEEAARQAKKDEVMEKHLEKNKALYEERESLGKQRDETEKAEETYEGEKKDKEQDSRERKLSFEGMGIIEKGHAI